MADFGFVGPSYEAPSIYQDAQECINYFLEIDPNKQGQRGYVALYPTPGLVKVCQPEVGAVRAMYTLAGSNPEILLVVIGYSVYRVNKNYTFFKVGNLSTNIGPVQISSNRTIDDGLIAYIVDGIDRYYYVYDTNALTKLPSSDGPWQGATVVDTIDNYNVYNEPNTNNWAATDLSSALSTNAYYGTKDGAPDSIVSIIVDHRQVYLLGQQTTEVWVDVGNVIQGLISFPFQRVSGTMMQHGCAAQHSVARFSETFMFVSRDARGQAIIGGVTNYAFQRVSTHAVEQSLLDKDVSDAIAYTYQLEGHEFYVVTFPSIDLTWVYDLTTQQWHKWLAWDDVTGYHRHRSNCGAFFNNVYLVGDYENGNIYQLNNSVYTENGKTIRRLRRAPHLMSDLQRQYFSEMQIQFQPGVGLTGVFEEPNTNSAIAGVAIAGLAIAGNASSTVNAEDAAINPQAMLRWSNDGGSTWSNEHWTSIGAQGRYKNRAIWRRLGWSRDRIFEVAVTAPVKTVIVSANLKAETGDN